MGGVRPAGDRVTGHYDGAVSQRAAGEPEPVQDTRLLAATRRVLLLASDQVFHRAGAAEINFTEPFTRLFEDGTVDGSLVPSGGDPAEAAELLFNTVCWSYVHLRGRHRWAARRARQGLRALIAPGLDAGPPGPAAR
jgi:hypothetical protein